MLLKIFCLLLVFETLGEARGPNWIKLTTTNFELYTTAGEKNARKTLDYFERLHTFFIRTMEARIAPSKRVCLVGFRGPREFRPYRSSETAAAYYLKAPDRDYIVMGELSGENDPVAVHEFIHLLISRAKLRVPTWLNEGMAEFYSTILPLEKTVIIGNLPAGRLPTLRNSNWISLADLIDPVRQQEFYHDRDRVGPFYAQSWLLAHMLAISADYNPKFLQFLAALHGGKSTEEAFEEVYNRSVSVVEGDLRSYASGTLYATKVDVKMEKEFTNPRVEAPETLEVELLLANLQDRGNEGGAADERWARLESEYASDPRLHSALGYRALYRGQEDLAGIRFGKAIELGCQDVQVWLDYEDVLHRTGAASDEISNVLLSAVKLYPSNMELRYRLGLTLAVEGRYEEALMHLARIQKVSAEQAVPYFQAVALGYRAKGDLDEARKAAGRALENSKSPDEKLRSERILEFIDYSAQAGDPPVREPAARQSASPEPPDLAAAAGAERDEKPYLTRTPRTPGQEAEPAVEPEREVEREVEPHPEAAYATVEGTLDLVECMGDFARIWIRTSERSVVLGIYDAKAVKVRGADRAVAELTCGSQRETLPVVVQYREARDMERNTAGAIHSIEFQPAGSSN